MGMPVRAQLVHAMYPHQIPKYQDLDNLIVGLGGGGRGEGLGDGQTDKATARAKVTSTSATSIITGCAALSSVRLDEQ